MLDTCTYENQRDFTARYKNTIGSLVKEDGTKEWVWIAGINEDNVVFTTVDGMKYTATIGKGTQFEFTQVPMGWYNSPEGPIFFSRKPARQWQRGISNSNTHIYDQYFNKVDLTLTRVVNAYTPQKPYKDQPCWALSKHFAFNRDNVLYFYDVPIGEKKDTSFFVQSCNVVQELSDAIKRNNLPFNVEIT